MLILRHSAILLALAVWGLCSQGNMAFAGDVISVFEVPYTGKLQNIVKVESVRNWVKRMLPAAIARAESLLAIPLRPQHVSFHLCDTPIGAKRTLGKMVTFGAEQPMVGLFVEPILRGSYADSSDVLRSLTHEIMHAIIRQNVAQEDYQALPEWFQEGVPVFLLQQGKDKLLRALHHEWKNPENILAGFEGDHAVHPYITGYFFCEELTARIGVPGLQGFLGKIIESGTTAEAWHSLAVPEEDLWPAARKRAERAIQMHSEDVAQQFADCMRLYREGRTRRQEAIQCFQDVIAEFPETYAGQASHYWLAKCYYHIREFDLARRWFQAFEKLPLEFGLLDNARYFQMRMLITEGKHAAAKRACEEYLKYFPDGDNRNKALSVCAELVRSSGD